MPIESTSINWILVFFIALLAICFGGVGMFYVSFKMYRTKKLSSLLIGSVLGNLVVAFAFSWGVLYFISDVILDLMSFEDHGFGEKIILISFVFAIVTTNILSFIILVRRNLDGKPLTNDLGNRLNDMPEDS